MTSEEDQWIYCQIFKETLSKMNENDRKAIREYCRDLCTEEDTYGLITTKRDLIEQYDSLCVTLGDSNPIVTLANLMLEKKDYDRAEYFYLQGLSSENENWSRQVTILDKLSEVFRKKNQLDKARQYYEQANLIKQQHLSKKQ